MTAQDIDKLRSDTYALQKFLSTTVAATIPIEMRQRMAQGTGIHISEGGGWGYIVEEITEKKRGFMKIRLPSFIAGFVVGGALIHLLVHLLHF